MEEPMKREYKFMLGGAAAVLLLAGAAVGGAYLMQQQEAPKQTASRTVRYQPTNMAASEPVRQAAPPCDDNNIVGTVGGGVAGGLVGSRFGSGNGKTVATTAGILGGAALGNKFIPTRGATCN
ncbi:MAG: hypothetical protein DI582_01165 [Azospirillum brasilense]|nr:MAG: hypothetical protein DI582_01165 [Azospirillum brasilense]